MFITILSEQFYVFHSKKNLVNASNKFVVIEDIFFVWDLPYSLFSHYYEEF